MSCWSPQARLHWPGAPYHLVITFAQRLSKPTHRANRLPNRILLPGNELGLVSLLALPSLLDIRGATGGQASLEREGGREKEKKTKMMVVQFFFRSCLGLFRCPIAKKEKLIATSAGPTKGKREARRGRGNAPYTLPPLHFLPPVSPLP